VRETEIIAKIDDLSRLKSRVMIGIAGIPGSGKSTWAEKLQKRLSEKNVTVRIVNMDGYHLPNKVLVDQNLKKRKGAIFTYDLEMYLADLKHLQLGAQDVRVPMYSREIHEPIPDATHIPKSVQVIISEGQYLFMNQPGWREVRDLFDYRIFIDTPIEVARNWTIARHIRGGLTENEAVAKYERNDLLNSQEVIPSSQFADIVFQPDRN